MAPHWTRQYVGLPYIVGACDCASLTERVQREQFGRTLCLPSAQGNNHRDWSKQIAEHKDRFVQPATDPQEGDIVLMAGRSYLNHIGTLVIIEHERYVLHAMFAAHQVCLHRLTRLDDVGLIIEGIYTWPA